jgi:hypothetical protein
MRMKIIVTDTRKAVFQALGETLGHLTIPRHRNIDVQILNESVESFDSEGVCFVNGGNSLGVMEGRLDSVVRELVPGSHADVCSVVEAWGNTARDGQKHLPLFSALLSPSHDRTRWLCSSPCMLTPGPGDLRETRNAFHSTHVALSLILNAVRAGVGIHTVVMTGMCTGRGRTNRLTAAHQMMDAFRAVFVDDNVVVDPSIIKHPRLMMNPLYTTQPITTQNEPFQPLQQHVTMDGTWEFNLPTTSTPSHVRSGGSEGPSPFGNLR